MVPGEDQILTNLRRGAVEYCVLAMLRDGEWYGLDLARELSKDQVLMAGEGTLYPLLARLRRAGLVDTSWRESTAGPPRRYYRLTREGATALDAFRRVWTRFSEQVDLALKGT
jgi:PadR family transcriptional regulator